MRTLPIGVSLIRTRRGGRESVNEMLGDRKVSQSADI